MEIKHDIVGTLVGAVKNAIDVFATIVDIVDNITPPKLNTEQRARAASILKARGFGLSTPSDVRTHAKGEASGE